MELGYKYSYLHRVRRILQKVIDGADRVAVDCGTRTENGEVHEASISLCTRYADTEVAHVDVNKGRERRVARQHGDVKDTSLTETIKKGGISAVENQLAFSEQEVAGAEGALLHY